MTQMTVTAKRLTIQIRLEPGCLGPDGKAHIDTFCAAATRIFAAIEPERLHWVLLPRHDKQLPEQEFFIDDRKLSEEQATQLIARMGLVLATLQERSDAMLALLVERYFKTL
ncbi:hypothetical protein [Aeromonas molluscorum]|jgi:hypothetical protein|uniref:Uncharacterized protein n=1 Tax=Aeromonas molluscorum 848 TaxID=1268236 RepID=R1F9I8_9GAMM|nr:hypothetical protein [Aeromonas molluscorum]EOD56367.1 hypothetical protein G113_03896 [Aeromonas molluscorum 848]